MIVTIVRSSFLITLAVILVFFVIRVMFCNCWHYDFCHISQELSHYWCGTIIVRDHMHVIA